MKRSELKRKKPMKRSGAKMKTFSKSRRERDKSYPEARRRVFDRAGGRCEANASLRCTRACEQVHHRAGRNVPDPHRVGLEPFAPDNNLLGCCAPCHAEIHARPELALERGWSLSRLSS